MSRAAWVVGVLCSILIALPGLTLAGAASLSTPSTAVALAPTVHRPSSSPAAPAASRNVQHAPGVVTTIPVGGQPSMCAYDPDNGLVYVGDASSDNVSIIDGTSVVASVDIPGPPLFGTFDPDNGYVYLTYGNRADEIFESGVAVFNNRTFLTNLSLGSFFPGGTNAYLFPYPIFDRVNGFVYIVESVGDIQETGFPGYVSVISGTTILTNITIGNDTINDATTLYEAYSPVTGDVYVAQFSSTNLTVIHGTNISGTIDLGEQPQTMVFDESNDLMYVSTGSEIVLLNGTGPTGTLPVASLVQSYSPSTGEVYARNTSAVSILNGTRVVANVSVGGNFDNDPRSLALDNSTGDLFGSNASANQVFFIRGSSIAGTVNVGKNPVSLLYDPQNQYVYVANFDSSNLSVIGPVAVIPRYLVQFTEVGLTLPTTWYAELNGTLEYNFWSTANFTEPNGTYLFRIPSDGLYIGFPKSGTVDVNGAPVEIPVTFVDGVTPLVTLLELYENRSDLQAEFPNASSGNWTSLAGLVGWASEIVDHRLTDRAFDELAAPEVGYYYVLLGVYNARPDLQAEFPDAYTNLTSYVDLCLWAANVVSGSTSDRSAAVLQGWGYAYDLFAVWVQRPDILNAFPGAFFNVTETGLLVNWAGEVVTGAFADSSKLELQPYASWYALMMLYDGRSDLQAAYPNAFTNASDYVALMNWAGGVVTDQFADSDNSTLMPFGYNYALVYVYDGRSDLQSAFPNALTNFTEYAFLVNWAGAVVNGSFVDSDRALLQPFGYFFALMWVYDGRSDLQSAYPSAFTNGTSYTDLLAWAKDVVTGVFPDSAVTQLDPYALYYETYR